LLSRSTYRAYANETDSGQSRNFDILESVTEMEREEAPDFISKRKEKDLKFPIVVLSGRKRRFKPVSEMMEIVKKDRVACDL